MGAGVVDHQQITGLNLRQHPVHSKFVVVFAQGAGDVILVVAGGILFSHHRDMMVGPVHGGTHQIGCAGVDPHVLFISVFEVSGLCHQTAVGSQHKSAQLGKDGHITHAGRDQDLLVFPAHTLTDGGDVVFSLLRTVGDTYAAGEIDEPNVAACLLPKLYRRLEEDTRQCGIIGVGEGVGGQKGVEAEMLGAQSPQLAEALGELRTGKAVFGVSGGVHDLEALLTCPDGEGAAGVVAAGDGFGDGSDGVFQEIDVGEVVQVDGGPQAGGQLKLLRGRIIGGEHDIRPRKAAAVGQHELCEGGAVRTTALFPQELQNGGSGGGLDGKILPVTWIPGKSGLQFSCVFPDAFLVVEVEGSGIPGRDGPELLQGDKRLFQGKTPAF